MADLDLVARSALDGVFKPSSDGSRDREPGVILTEHRAVGLMLILAHKGETTWLRDMFERNGIDLPLEPRRTLARDVEVVWTAPRQWLAVVPVGDVERFRTVVHSLEAACTLVPFDDARTLLSLTGARARDTLAKMLPIDLHPRAFGPGDAAVTVAGSISTTLWQVDDAPTYRLAVPRSFAAAFWRWLTQSAAEYGYVVLERRGTA